MRPAAGGPHLALLWLSQEDEEWTGGHLPTGRQGPAGLPGSTAARERSQAPGRPCLLPAPFTVQGPWGFTSPTQGQNVPAMEVTDILREALTANLRPANAGSPAPTMWPEAVPGSAKWTNCSRAWVCAHPAPSYQTPVLSGHGPLRRWQ